MKIVRPEMKKERGMWFWILLPLVLFAAYLIILATAYRISEKYYPVLTGIAWVTLMTLTAARIFEVKEEPSAATKKEGRTFAITLAISLALAVAAEIYTWLRTSAIQLDALLIATILAWVGPIVFYVSVLIVLNMAMSGGDNVTKSVKNSS